MSEGNVTAYPLSWPLGHPRANYRQDSKFGTNGPIHKRTSLTEVLKFLQDELDRLGAREVVLSSNLELRLDGLPRGNQAMPRDPGVAVYFKLKRRPMVLPCDKWNRVECNLMAVAKHIEAMRGLQRWGVGTVEQHFEGFARLPEKASVKAWYQVLQVSADASEDDVNRAFKALAKDKHPDVGGDPDQWHELQVAREHGLAASKAKTQPAMTS